MRPLGFDSAVGFVVQGLQLVQDQQVYTLQKKPCLKRMLNQKGFYQRGP